MLPKVQALVVVICSTVMPYISSLSANDEIDNNKLLDQFVESQGLKNSIVFDSSNIKQYWIDKSVVSNDKSIVIQLNKKDTSVFESIPLKIQLANIFESLDCTVEIITDDPTFSFSILNSKSTSLSKTIKEDSFLTYRIKKTTFHLEDADNLFFNLVFYSNTNSSLKIYKIILGFEKNKNSIFRGLTEYSYLVQEFSNNVQKVPNSEVCYLIDSKRNVLYLRIPPAIADLYYYFYLVTPINKEDLRPNRVQYGYNNFDSEVKKGIINHDANTSDEYQYIKVYLPSYEYSSLEVGQIDQTNKRRIWTLKFNSDTLKEK